MPKHDGTGPLGTGPIAGRGRGLGNVGFRPGRIASTPGREANRIVRSPRKGFGGSKKCTCPKCGHIESHTRGIPCSEKKCPKCETPMRGAICL